MFKQIGYTEIVNFKENIDIIHCPNDTNPMLGRIFKRAVSELHLITSIDNSVVEIRMPNGVETMVRMNFWSNKEAYRVFIYLNGLIFNIE